MDITTLRDLSTDTLGVFTTAMARDAGFSRTALCRLRAAGMISRVCGHGHILGTAEPTIEQRAVAACLTWPDAVVCERTAGILHGLIDKKEDDGVTHVLVPDGRRAFAGLVAHHWSVRPTEVERRHAWTMTDRRTTLADCLGRFDGVEAWGLFAWLATRDKITVADIEAQLTDRYHLYGVVRLRGMAAALRRGAVSPAEVELHDFLKKCEFTGWAGNQKIWHRGRIVANADVLFFVERLVIEFDGRLAHPKKKGKKLSGRQRKDAARDRLLERLGYKVIRVRWERLVNRPDVLRGEIQDALAARAAGAA